jgi:trimeric autotransporter adhesin
VPNLNFIAKYSGGTWVALSNHGLNGPVRTLAVSGSDMYVGGQFDFTNDMNVLNLTNIAKYSGGTWSALTGQGLNGIVMALAVNGNDLYAGGAFTQTHNSLVTNLNHIARYDIGGGTWSALAHHGLNNNVAALAVNGNDLYAGGYFAKTSDNAVTDLNYIARYDTSGGAWSALPNQGLSSDVFVLKVIGADLYVGGDFGGTFDATYTGQFVKLGAGYSVYLPLIIR